MSYVKRLWQYWRENIKIAKEGHEMTVLVALICWQFIYLLAKFLGVHAQPVREFSKSELFDLTEKASIFIFVVIAIVWLPVRRHEEDKRKSDAQITEKQSENSRLRAEVKRLKDDRERKALEADFLDMLQTQLGMFHQDLLKRIAEIRCMRADIFAKEDEESFKNNEWDATSQAIIWEIQKFLSETRDVPGTYIAIFNDTNEMETTKTPRYEDKHTQVIIDYWQLILDRLKHHAKQLMKIIEMEAARQANK